MRSRDESDSYGRAPEINHVKSASHSAPISSSSDIPRVLVDLSLGSRLILLLVYLFMCVFGYLAMLLVMTYNLPVLILLVVGLAVGHFVFSIVGLPSLPDRYLQVAGSGAYLPESDNCCSHVPQDINEEYCPCEEKNYMAVSQTQSPMMMQTTTSALLS